MQTQERTLRTRLEFYDFEMFSKKGNTACRKLVTKVFNRIEGNHRVCKEHIINLLKEGVEKISEIHPEVNDTEPGYHISELVTQMCDQVGYKYKISRWDF
jgi:hypothetical protein